MTLTETGTFRFDGSRPTWRRHLAGIKEAEEEVSMGYRRKDPAPAREPEFGSQEFHFTYGDNRAMRDQRGSGPPSQSGAVTLSIAGHAFWNGSSFLSYYLPDAYGMGGSATVLSSSRG